MRHMKRIIQALLILIISFSYTIQVLAVDLKNPKSLVSDNFNIEVQVPPSQSEGFVTPVDGQKIIASAAKSIRVEFMQVTNSNGKVPADSYTVEYSLSTEDIWKPLITNGKIGNGLTESYSNGSRTAYFTWNAYDLGLNGQYKLRVSCKNNFGISPYTYSGEFSVMTSVVTQRSLVSDNFSIKKSDDTFSSTIIINAIDEDKKILKTVTLTNQSDHGRTVSYKELGDVPYYHVTDVEEKFVNINPDTKSAEISFTFGKNGMQTKNPSYMTSNTFNIRTSSPPENPIGFVTPHKDAVYVGDEAEKIKVEWAVPDYESQGVVIDKFILYAELTPDKWTEVGTYTLSSLEKGNYNSLITYSTVIDGKTKLKEGYLRLGVVAENISGKSERVISDIFRIKFTKDQTQKELVSDNFSIIKQTLPKLEVPTVVLKELDLKGEKVYDNTKWALNPLKPIFTGSEYKVFPSPKVRYQYRFDMNSQWLEFKPAENIKIEIQGQSTMYYRAIDEVGNVSDDGSIDIKIDSKKPVINITKEVNGSATVLHIVVTDEGTGVDTITLPNNTTHKGDKYDYTVDKEGELTIKAKDLAGNESELKYFVDNTPPSLTITKVGNYLVANATDNGSGVRRIKLDGESWVYGNEVIKQVEKIGIYKFIAEDKMGNQTVQEFEISEIVDPGQDDKTAPMIFISREGNTLTAFAIDDKSGVKKMFGPDGTMAEGNMISYTATAPGTYTFKAVDNVGNIAQKSYDVISLVDIDDIKNDKIAPTIHEYLINYGAKQTSNNNVLLVLSATDDKSPQANLKVEFSLDGKTWKGFNGSTYTTGFKGVYQSLYKGFDIGVQTGIKYITIKVTDEAGNSVTKVASIELLKVADVPDIVGGGNGTGTSPTDYILLKNSFYNLKLQNLKGDYIQYSIDGITWSPWERVPLSKETAKVLNFNGAEGIHTANVRTKKVYGLSNEYEEISDVTTYYFMIDNMAPNFSIRTIDGSHIAMGGNISFIVESSDNVEETVTCSITVYNQNNQVVAESLNKPINLTSPSAIPLRGLTRNEYFYVMFKIKDKAGNITTKSINILSK
jgi:hypothetical protein